MFIFFKKSVVSLLEPFSIIGLVYWIVAPILMIFLLVSLYVDTHLIFGSMDTQEKVMEGFIKFEKGSKKSPEHRYYIKKKDGSSYRLSWFEKHCSIRNVFALSKGKRLLTFSIVKIPAFSYRKWIPYKVYSENKLLFCLSSKENILREVTGLKNKALNTYFFKVAFVLVIVFFPCVRYKILSLRNK